MTAVQANFTSTETRGKIGIITMSNDGKRNALSEGLLDEINNALDEFEKNCISAVILRAKPNSKVWSAGHDIKELPTHADPLGYYDPLEETLRKIQQFPGAVICMIQGGVWGGACDLIMTADIVIGDPTCTFAITPVKLGLPYNASGILHFMNRLGVNIAKEMFFTAEPVAAERAKELGILNHLVAADQLEEFTLALAEKITSHSALSMAVIKEQFRLLSNAHPVSPETFERIQGLRRKVYFSQDYAEGIKAFLEKRPPKFSGQ
ncbi:MAG: methylmalonyl-CoA decarboxylase [Candidatus Melainabacteria bacterium]|nr:methylmalonyl-CoA decarboxylase [Candidatus Melainabacteria bacterium]